MQHWNQNCRAQFPYVDCNSRSTVHLCHMKRVVKRDMKGYHCWYLAQSKLQNRLPFKEKWIATFSNVFKTATEKWVNIYVCWDIKRLRFTLKNNWYHLFIWNSLGDTMSNLHQTGTAMNQSWKTWTLFEKKHSTLCVHTYITFVGM